jgi:hypothetical protein
MWKSFRAPVHPRATHLSPTTALSMYAAAEGNGISSVGPQDSCGPKEVCRPHSRNDNLCIPKFLRHSIQGLSVTIGEVGEVVVVVVYFP